MKQITKYVGMVAILSVFVLATVSGNIGEADAKIDVKVEVIKTIPLNDNGSYQHFVKICSDENNRLERPNVIVSSDTETYREQLDVNLPPTFCTHQEFTIDAQNPDSINIMVIGNGDF